MNEDLELLRLVKIEALGRPPEAPGTSSPPGSEPW